MSRAGERLLATRLMSVLFSARVGTALALTVPPFWVLVAIAPARWTHRLTQHWARVIATLCGCRPIVTGAPSLPSGTGIVMVANHSSFLDSVVLLAAIPGDYRFVANHLAARRPLLGTVIRKSGHLVVDRGSARSRAACARAMVKTLQSGTPLLLFPEGTRGRRGLLPFHMGAFRTAEKTSCPVVPVAIDGTRRMLPRDRRLLEPAPLAIHVLEAITADPSAVRRAAALRDQARAAIVTALPES